MALRERLRDPGGQIQPGQFRQRLDKLPRSGFVQQRAPPDGAYRHPAAGVIAYAGLRRLARVPRS